MTASNSSAFYFPRNPKFTDAFERDLANDTIYHLGRDEPSNLLPLLARLGASLMRGMRTLRASAQQSTTGLSGS